MDRIFDYAYAQEDHDSWNYIVEAIFDTIRPQLDANTKRYEDWKRWWRPSKIETIKPVVTTHFENEKPVVKTHFENEKPVVKTHFENEKPVVTTHFENEKPNVNDNVNVNVNDNDNENVNENENDLDLSEKKKRKVKTRTEIFFDKFNEWDYEFREEHLECPELTDMFWEIERKVHIDLSDQQKRKMILEFVNHWGQKGERDKKAKWQKEGTFEIFARMRTWRDREEARSQAEKPRVRKTWWDTDD